MPLLRTPPSPPQKKKGKTIYKQQFLHSDWYKTCQLIPNQWNFTSATLNDIRFVFYHNIKEIFVKIC